MRDHRVKLKRVYEKADKSDGYRILVDRLWPRGVAKAKAEIDLWMKDIAPGNELRKWFNHEPARWNEFINKYAEELDYNQNTVNQLKSIVQDKKIVTLVYGASDTKHNHALALIQILKLDRQ